MSVTYLVEVAPILHGLGASLDISDALPVDSYTVGGLTYTLPIPPRFDVTVTNTGTGIVVFGRIKGDAIASCARCAADFTLRINGEVEGFYVREGDTEGLPDAQEVEFIDSQDRIDIAPALLATIVFVTPYVPLCSENCKGLCSDCGADLNVDECSCEEGLDPLNPFAALVGLNLDDNE